MRRALPVLVAVALVLTVPALSGRAPTSDGLFAPDVAKLANAGPLVVLVLGDTGTGLPDQARVASSAHAACASKRCDLALVLGDNIYERGVTSVNDTQFDTKFEAPYAAFTIPFRLVLGNHDDVDRNGDFEVQYTYRADRASDKWTMPARFHAFEARPVLFVGWDTNTLVRGDAASLAAAEAWTEATIAASEQPWVVALGHHPYVSNGRHGDAGAYNGVAGAGAAFASFFEETACGRADLYLAGHDHDLQWLAPDPACGRTEFFVSGAGAKTRPLADPARHEARFQAGSTLGFWILEFRGPTLRATAYDGDGAILHEGLLVKSTGLVVPLR